MKKFLNITAIATIAMMSCACNEEAIEPSDDWKDVPVEENLTDYIYFEDGSFTTATVDFTLNQTEFSYKVIRKSENGLDCKADVTLLTEEELASEGSYYARIPAEYFEVTPSVEFTENDEAEVTVSFNADKATEVAEFITSSRNSEKSPCIAIRLDVNGDNGIVASKKAGYLIISWSYDNASACRISAELEGAERPLYIDLVPYTELPAISVNHFSSCKINVNHFSGNIVGEVKVNAAFDEAAAAEYADSVGVDVITSSLGYFSFDEERLSYKPSQLDGRTSLISRGASMAARKGILVFSSAGNEGNSSWGTITVPADADGILTVGAIDEKKKRSLFSSIGYSADGRVKPDVVALGTDCAVIEPDGALRFSSGTSFATPILAGACACVWQALPWLTSRDLVRLVREYASLSKQPNPELGYGLPNLYKLYKKEKRYAPKD